MTSGVETSEEDPQAAAAPRGRDGRVQSVGIAAGFLRVLADAEHALSLGEVARQMGAGRSTAHRYLQSLVRDGLAQQDPASGHYDLGPLALSIGIAALRRIDPVEIAGRHMKDLAQFHAVSAGVAIWTERGPTVVRWYPSAYFSISAVGLGSILPINNTACGLVCQAHLSAAAIEAARAAQPEHFRGTPPSAELLDQVRSDGWCELRSHLLSNVAGEAAPVFDAQGALVCVITAVADLGQSRSAEQIDALREAARAINLETGGTRARMGRSG